MLGAENDGVGVVVQEAQRRPQATNIGKAELSAMPTAVESSGGRVPG